MLSPPRVLLSTRALPALEEVAGLIQQTVPALPRIQVEDSGFKGTRECINSDLEIELDQSTPCMVTTRDRCEEVSPAGNLSLDEPSQVPKVVNLPRSQRVVAKRPPSAHSAFYVIMGDRAADNTEEDLISYWESVKSGQCREWKTAMRKGFKSLEDNEMWSIIRRSSIGHSVHPIGCKLVFRRKINPDGSVHFKTRLVIKGYKQQIFGETFAPVVWLMSIRLVLALATLNRWKIHHLDVCTAFLNPWLEDTV